MTPGPRETAPERAQRPGHRRILGAAPGTGGPVRRLRPAALAAWREQDQQPPAARRQPSRFPPASAALTAALAATAMTVLTGSDEQAIEQIRALLPPRAGPRRPRPAGLPAPRWRQLSQRARGRFLRALDPDLSPADRIRYRTGTPQAAIPADPPGLLAARARAIPQLLWPDWAIRLMPARGFAPGPFRSAIAACLLLPGHPGRATRTAITAPARLPQRPGRRRGAAGAGRRRPRHRAHRDQLPGRLPGHQRQPHRLPAPPRPHPRRDDHRRRSGTTCATAPPRTPARPAGTATPSATCSSCSPAPTCTTPGTPSRSPAPTTTATTTPSPAPSPPGCGTRCTTTPPRSCTTWASASR